MKSKTKIRTPKMPTSGMYPVIGNFGGQRMPIIPVRQSGLSQALTSLINLPKGLGR